MIVFRICKSGYAHDLSGKGAELYGGRWNSKGVAAIYVSPGIALCTAEVAVHLPLGDLPVDFVLVAINVPDVAVKEINANDLPKEWKQFPNVASTQEIGNQFIREGEFLLLKVPSSVVPGEYIYVINPAHRDAPAISVIDVQPYQFDKRLFDR